MSSCFKSFLSTLKYNLAHLSSLPCPPSSATPGHLMPPLPYLVLPSPLEWKLLALAHKTFSSAVHGSTLSSTQFPEYREHNKHKRKCVNKDLVFCLPCAPPLPGFLLLTGLSFLPPALSYLSFSTPVGTDTLSSQEISDPTTGFSLSASTMVQACVSPVSTCSHILPDVCASSLTSHPFLPIAQSQSNVF